MRNSDGIVRRRARRIQAKFADEGKRRAAGSGGCGVAGWVIHAQCQAATIGSAHGKAAKVVGALRHGVPPFKRGAGGALFCATKLRGSFTQS